DGSILVADGRAWRPATGERVRALDGILALGGDGRRALIRRGRSVAVVEAPSGRIVVRLDDAGRLTRAAADVTAVLDREGNRALTSDYGRSPELWDTRGGRLVAKLPRKGENVIRSGFS